MSESQVPQIQKSSHAFVWMIVLLVLAVAAVGGYVLYATRQEDGPASNTRTNTISNTVVVEPPAEGPIMVKGFVTCLPKITAHPNDLITEECAIGLKAEDGSYFGFRNLGYALDSDTKAKKIGDFDLSGASVKVTGTFRLHETYGPDGNKYDTLGDIDVTEIEQIVL